MSVRLSGHRLQHELALRCMSARDAAKKTGLSDATWSAALSSRYIAEASARLICEFLDTTPVSEFMQKLIGPYVPPPGADPPPAPPTEQP
jgi:lambda repressor-like predicted transcriptional regulator